MFPAKEMFAEFSTKMPELKTVPQVSQKAGTDGMEAPINMPNVELTGAARLYRAASSDRRERG
jgi:hypothetical protein